MPMTLSRGSYAIGRRKQSGVVLVITLIVLVAMTLAAISLIRSVDTTNIIAGNLAFHTAATESADIGLEQATTLLSQIHLANGLLCNAQLPPPAGCTQGYRSWVQPQLEPPFPNTTWESYWNNVSVNAEVATNPPNGFTISFVIERMCDDNTQASTCSRTVPIPNVARVGCSVDNPNDPCPPIKMTYYRITVRAAGPRNTVSYTQSIIAM